MRIRKIDRKIEKNILIGLITDKSFLAQISVVYDPSLFKNPYARTVSKWCMDYYKKYEEAPFKEIKNIFEYHDKRGDVKDDQVDPIEKLLEEINRDYQMGDSLNIQFLLDKAQEYFTQLNLEKSITFVQNCIQTGEIKKAEGELFGYKQISLTAENAVDPLINQEKMDAAFAESADPLFTLPGAFGCMINEHLVRDSMIAIQAPEKSGKTYTLYYFAKLALMKRLKVLIIQTGDLTENQSRVRLSISIAKKSNKIKYCGKFKVPIRFTKFKGSSNDKYCPIAPENMDIEYEEVNIESPLTANEAIERNSEFYQKFNVEENKYLKLITRSPDTINIRGIEAEMDILFRAENFIPDVVIIDYMDILAKEDNRVIGRDAVNDSWKAAAGLAKKKHVLLITATQSDSKSYDGELQSRQNFTEDKRKIAHVTVMIGMNKTDEEKRFGLVRCNVVAAREGDFLTSLPCYIIQNLRTGQAIIDSYTPDVNITALATVPKRKIKAPEESSKEQSDNEKTKNYNGRINIRKRK